MTRTPEQFAYHNMLARCRRPNHPAFKNYGGRGIEVCARWAGSFAAFLQDMGARPSPLHSLDRINVEGHYSPGNCRWATLSQQRRNMRGTRGVASSDGRHFDCVQDAAEAVGRDEAAVRQAIKRGGKCAGLHWRHLASQERLKDDR